MTAQNMGKKILTQAGYEVVAVSNGAAAVKKIAEHKPDLAVLDVYMPGYTGLEVCERVKNAVETSHMPVILTVGKIEPFKPEEAARVKADGLIIKPFEASDLIAAVQKLEQKLYPPTARVEMIPAGAEAPTPEYERTQKIEIPFSGDSGYQDWQQSAEEHLEEGEEKPSHSTAPMQMPQEMAASPAFGLDHFDEGAPASGKRSTQSVDATVLLPPKTATLKRDTQPEVPVAAFE